MHLHTVRNSRYYSGPPVNISHPVHCLNMGMPLSNVTNTTHPSNLTSKFSFTLHARDIDARENQGMSTVAIVGIIAGVIFEVLCVAALIGWAHKSNRAAFAASGGRRGEVRRGNGNGGHADLEKGSSSRGPSFKHAYSSNAAGMPIPPRSYDGSKTKGPLFPGPRNGFNTSRRGGCSARPAQGSRGHGPYADDSPFAATPTMAPRESPRQSRNQYSIPSVNSAN